MKASSASLILIVVITGLILVEKNKLKRRLKKQEIQALIYNLEKLHLEKEELVIRKQKLQEMKDSLSEMGEMDMLYLQQLMDQQTKLESMIANLMKAISEVQGVIVAKIM